MQTLKDNNQLQIEILNTRNAIKAAIGRLKIRDLLLEAVRQIHFAVQQDPNGTHATTAIDTNRKQTLLVGCVFRNGLFADIGILAVSDYTNPEVYNALMETFEHCVEALTDRMTGSCI